MGEADPPEAQLALAAEVDGPRVADRVNLIPSPCRRVVDSPIVAAPPAQPRYRHAERQEEVVETKPVAEDGGVGCVGENATNGRLRTNSRTADSELRAPQPSIVVTRHNRLRWKFQNSMQTATASSSERKRCAGTYLSRPIWIASAGWARRFRIHSVFGPQAEQTTACFVSLS